MKYKYKIVFDNGKPYEIMVNSDDGLKYELKRFYNANKGKAYFDAIVFNKVGDDISESQFIEEMIGDII